MSIASELQRLQQAKADIIEAIEAQGVTVPEGSTLDELAELIDAIEGGGGGGGFPYPDPPVTSMKGVFGYARLAGHLDVRNVITRDVTNMVGVFTNQSNITSVDVSNWDTRNVETFQSMFLNDSKLTALDLSSWDTSNLEVTEYMFRNCSLLAEIDLSSWDTSSLVTTTSMFQGCSALTSLYAKDTASADKFMASSNFPSGVDVYIGPKGSATYYKTST